MLRGEEGDDKADKEQENTEDNNSDSPDKNNFLFIILENKYFQHAKRENAIDI